MKSGPFSRDTIVHRSVGAVNSGNPKSGSASSPREPAPGHLFSTRPAVELVDSEFEEIGLRSRLLSQL